MIDFLLEKGYKEFPKQAIFHPGATNNYQKCFRDDKGRQFFLTAYRYDLAHLVTGHKGGPSFQFEAQFYGGELSINVSISVKNEAEYEQMEALFFTLWRASGGQYYELYKDS